jgi:hypothetical protein
VQATKSRPQFEVVADGQGIVSHVGAALLSELSDRLGLTAELGRRANRGRRHGARDRGQVLRDLVVMLADGGDCVSDLAGLRQQPALFGEVASTSTAWRVLVEELGDARQVAALWSALARVRQRAWALGAAPAGAGPLILIVCRGLWFSIGFDCDQRVQAAILALPEEAFTPALDADGRPRRGAWVAELAGLDLASAGWPPGTRTICRRERPHPGARHKMGFTDAAGHRFQVFITNQPDPDPAIVEARHRPHAHVEDRIRTAKATGLGNLPFFEFGANDAWLTLVCVAQTLVCWAQALLLDDPQLKVAEPKTLRYRLWHAAGWITRHARRLIIHLDRAWPWANLLVTAFSRLQACPPAADHGTPPLVLPPLPPAVVSGCPPGRYRSIEHHHDAGLAKADHAEPGGPVGAPVTVDRPSSAEPHRASRHLTTQQASVKNRG